MARGRSFTARPAKRAKAWANMGESGFTEAFSANGTQIIGGTVGQTFESRSTILRCRGHGIIQANGAVAGDQAVLTLGLGLVDLDAFNAGDGSMPDPADDERFGWLWFGSFPVFTGTPLTDVSQVGGAVRYEIDTKAMRVTRLNQVLVLIGQYVDVTGTPPVEVVQGIIRVLSALA